MKYLALVLSMVIVAANAVSQESNGLERVAPAPQPQLARQTLCPVMEGKRIKSRRYVDYQGYRIYVCCRSCVKAVRKNPEKYLRKLLDQQVDIAKTE